MPLLIAPGHRAHSVLPKLFLRKDGYGHVLQNVDKRSPYIIVSLSVDLNKIKFHKILGDEPSAICREYVHSK